MTILRRLRRILACRRGNVAIVSAVIAPIMLSVLGLAIDYGGLTLQKRRLQMAADMASIVAASSPGNAVEATQHYLADNGYKILVVAAQDSEALTSRDRVDAEYRNGNFDGIAVVSTGSYLADAKLAVNSRFASTPAASNAIRIVIAQRGDMNFATAFATPPLLRVRGIAANRNEAAFSIGSRFASVRKGVVNGMLGAMLGSGINLDVMDYDALAASQIDLLQFSRKLAGQIGVQGLSYAKLLDTKVMWPQFLAALSESTTDSRVKLALRTLSATSASKLALTPSQTIGVGSFGDLLITGASVDSSQAVVKARMLDVVMAALGAANQNKQMSFDVEAAPLGLLAVKIRLAIGERMVTRPAVRLDQVGSSVRTAQTRLSVEVITPGLAKLLGLGVRVPIYLEAAYSEVRLADIACSAAGNRNGTVRLEVRPGAGELFLGSVDPAQMADFSASPRVSRAELLNALLIKATGYAHGEITNLDPRSVLFDGDDIERGTVKNVATRNAIETLVASALSETDINLSLIGLTLGSSVLVTDSLQRTLQSAAPAIDGIIADIATVLGLKIGEADVSVTDLACNRSVLVQ